MKKLQAQLNPLAENNCEKIAVVLEGRDTAGKSSTIRAVTEYLNPAWYSIVPSTKPSASTMAQWLSYWATKFPNKGQMVFYDRSWYSRAMVQRLNNWCTDTQYHNFLKNYPEWEAGANASGVRFIKFWLSISENDENALSYYDRMTLLKEKVVGEDWHVVDYNDKQKGIERFLQILIRECST